MIRNIFCGFLACLATAQILHAQINPDSIDEQSISQHIRVLASDSLKGRGNGSVNILKAGNFIGERFKTAGLIPMPGMESYYVPFRPFGGSKRTEPHSLLWNGKKLKAEQFIFLNPVPGVYPLRSLHDFQIIALDTFITGNLLLNLPAGNEPVLFWTNKAQPSKEDFFPAKFTMPGNGLQRSILIVFADNPPLSIQLQANDKYFSMLGYNVVAMLPGKSRSNEIIAFTAHYDHEGVFPGQRDSILNGANDNASGTTAILALAEYYAKKNDNERTILFCAFAGEELGLKGSEDFVQYINADSIMAVINIEMIGVPQYGKDKLFFTGVEFSDLPEILEAGWKSSVIRTMREPWEFEDAFKRSDNYPFALQGIPAHTIMSSDDQDECYHSPCDEVERIDIPHMTNIIRAIAMGTEDIIKGEKTPARINKRRIQ
jgi:hypothetical protein